MSITLNLNNAGDTGTTAFTEQTPVLLFSTATISTSGLTDSGLLGTGRVDTITIALASHTATMVLSLNPAATSTATANGVTVSYNSGEGTLTLTGSNESNANWQTILRGVQYNDTSDTPTTPTSVLVTARNTAAGGGTGTDTQNITVTAVNDAPTATNLSAAETYTEDTALNLTGIVASDVDSATITATLTLSHTAAGSLTTATSGAVTSTYNAGTGVWTAAGELADVNTLLAGVSFTPAANFNSDFTIATNISDGSLSVSGTKIMTGTAVNDAPAGSASATLADGTEDVNYTVNAIDLLAGFTDVDAGDTLSISGLSVVSPDLGTTVINNPDGSFTISHPLNYNGPVTLSYNVIDGNGGSVAGSQSYTLAAANVNDAPTATNLSAAETYTEDTALNLTGIVASDVDSATITATLTLSNTAAGSLTTATSGAVTSTYDAGTGVWTAAGELADVNTLLAGVSFTPAANFNSDFTIDTNISDGSLSVSGTKIMTGTAVNDAPAGSASATLADGTEDVNYTVNAIDLLAGFTDVDAGDTLSISGLSVVSPDLGTTVINNPDGSFTISHPLNYNGPVTLSYNVIDGNGGSVAGSQSYTLAAANVNDAPTATNLSAAETYTEDTALNLTGIVASDVDSATITATLTLSNTAAGSLTTATSGAVTSTYDAGTGVWTAAGELADVNTLLAGVSFTPAANFNSDFTIDTNISDGSLSVSGTKIMTGTAVNDAPTGSASATLAAGTEDVNYTVNAIDLLAGFTDVDAGDTLSISGLSVVSPDLGTTVTNNPDGSFTISHPLNYNGPVTLSYDVIDGNGGSVAGSQSYTLAAANVNDAPTATNLSAAETYTEDTALNLTGIVASDVDSATITATLTLSNTAAGSLTTATSGAVTSTYNAGTGVWTAAGALADVNTLLAGVSFTPAANFNSDFTIDTNISDGSLSVSGTKIMTGTAVNDAPAGSASATLAAGTEDVNYTVNAIDLLAGFTDVDAGDTLSISGLSVVSPDLGTTVINNPDGSFTISHPLNYNGPVTLSYDVIDGNGGSVAGSQSYTLAAVNEVLIQDTRINTYTTGEQDSPSIATLTNGGFVVTWESYGQDGSSDGIYGQRYDASGATQGAEFRVNTSTASNQAEPSVTALINGGYVVIWRSDSQTGIYGQRYDASGVAQGVEFRANSLTDVSPFEPSVAALTDGGFVVAWKSFDQSSGEYDIRGQRYDASGAAQDAEFIVNTNPTGDQESPSVAALNDGGFVVTWQSYDQVGDGSEYDIYGQRYDATGAASGEFLVNTNSMGNQESPSVAALNDGFVVTWQSYQQDGGEYGIYGQRYDSSGVVQGNEFIVNTDTSSNQLFSSVAALTGGGFVVTWLSNQQNGSSYEIYGQRYDATGNAQGTEFQISSNPVNSAHFPTVTGLADGGFVVGWTSFDLDGSGVFGKRYDAYGNEIDWSGYVNHAPALTGAQAILVAGTEDINYTVNAAALLEGFSDVDASNTLSISGLSADRGTVTENPIGTFTITHAANYNGPVVLSYNVIDGHGGSVAGSQSYTLAAVNDVPALTATQTVLDAGTENSPYTVSAAALLEGFTDVDAGDTLSISGLSVVSPDLGTTVINNPDGSFTISHPLNYNGPVTLSYNVIDGNGGSVAGSQSYTLSASVNHAPTLIVPLVDQAVKYDTLDWSYDAGSSFNDADISDSLLYSATLANGNSIPNWMHIDEATGIMTGSPGFNDRGTYALSITATDTHGSGVSAPLTVAVTAFDAGQLLVSTNGNDILAGTISNDTVTYAYAVAPVTASLAIAAPQNTGGAGLDTLTSIDNLIGSDFNDILTGNTQKNVLDGGIGADALKGGAGDDTYIVDNAGDVITESSGAGTDTVNSSVTYYLPNNVENLVLMGALAINGVGNTLANTITGNAANNYLDGWRGADTLIGGAGDDSYIVDDAGDVITENLNEGTDKVNSSVTYILSSNVENLTLTGTLAINGTGNDLANTLIGNSAANLLDGGIGADALKGGAGDDTYIVDNAGDVITESSGAGTDTVNSSVTYYLPNNVENLVLMGALAINGVGNTLANTITGNAANNYLDGWRGADTLIGGAGDDSYIVDDAGDVITENLNEGTDKVNSSVTYILSSNVENLTLTGALAINGTGNDLANTLIGNSAANLLDGGIGADVLKGGAGDDTYIVDNAGDVITENSGAGTDTVNSSVTYYLPNNVENLALMGALAINGVGNILANTITGNAANNYLDGLKGADTLIGGAGDDTYIVDNAGDVIIENLNEGTDKVNSSVTYILSANVENLTLTGTLATNGTGNDLANSITGNAASNILDGGAGNDTLNGGAGANTLTGGLGKDIFRFNTASHTDIITDFVVVDDTIQLENAVFSALTVTGTLAASSFVKGDAAVALDANDFIIYDSSAGKLLYDSDGNGGGAPIEIATIGVGLAMTNADFVVI